MAKLKSLKPADLVVRFMRTVGHQRDAEHYLELFTSVEPESFAIVICDEEILANDGEALALELRYLTRLGLFPVLMFHTSPGFGDIQDPLSHFKKMKLKVSALDGSLSLPASIQEDVKEVIARGALPIIYAPLALSIAELLPPLATALKTKKLIVLTANGGLVSSEKQEPIGMINLRQTDEVAHYKSLLSPEDNNVLDTYTRILRAIGHQVHVTVTSPLNLLHELFTVKGAGTLIYYGSLIHKYHAPAQLDHHQLAQLLETSFEKRLKYPIDSIDVDIIYLEEHFQGAIFIKEVGPMAYLSKFAVGLEARGLGVGRDLWKAALADYPKLFWRADPHKFIASWYAKQCDGMQKGNRWNIYWIGLDPQEILKAIDFAVSQGEDFA